MTCLSCSPISDSVSNETKSGTPRYFIVRKRYVGARPPPLTARAARGRPCRRPARRPSPAPPKGAVVVAVVVVVVVVVVAVVVVVVVVVGVVRVVRVATTPTTSSYYGTYY